MQARAVSSWVFLSSVFTALPGLAADSATPQDRTFNKDVVPILYKNCVVCHRPNDIAPMSLVTYKDARPWAASIREAVLKRTMPPWHADPHTGEYMNDPRLSKEDIATVR
jgi:hypothetical protein